MPSWAEVYLTASHPAFYPMVFVLLLLAGLGFPISADLVLLTCSYIAYTGHAEVAFLIPISIAGILLSDVGMFHIGKHLGYGLTQVWPLKKALTPERIERAKQGYQFQGYKLVFFARFMPGIRTVFMFTGGLMRLRFWKFLAYDFAGALIVIPCTLYSMSWVAGNKEAILVFIKKTQWFVLAAVAVYLGFWFWKRAKRRASLKASAETGSDLSAPNP